jgi:hypothetical protein
MKLYWENMIFFEQWLVIQYFKEWKKEKKKKLKVFSGYETQKVISKIIL